MISDIDNGIVFFCDCYHSSHCFRINYINSDSPEEVPDVYLSIHLVKKKFWSRVWLSIKYVLGFQSAFGEYDDFSLSRNDIVKLTNYFSNKVLKHG